MAKANTIKDDSRVIKLNHAYDIACDVAAQLALLKNLSVDLMGNNLQIEGGYLITLRDADSRLAEIMEVINQVAEELKSASAGAQGGKS